MADIKITLPGAETVTLTGQTIDKLIRAGDGDAALLYLYILKTRGQSTDSEAAIALDKSKGWVASAMATLSRLGLVNLNDAETGARTSDTAHASDTARTSDTARAGGVATRAVSGAAPDNASMNQFKEPREYTENEVIREISSGSDFSIVVDEIQRRLGKKLSGDELLRLYGIYDNLRLPPEVILQLITHCINECRTTGDGRAPSVRYIEKAAFTWEREGVFTLERAEEYLKALEARKSARGKIKQVLQIRNREFTATEKKCVDDWITMGFSPEAIAIAYDRTVVKTGNPAVAYTDAIIRNWHSKGLHTPQEITEKDSRQNRSTFGTNAKTGSQKHGEPNREEMERMQQLLKKIKEN